MNYRKEVFLLLDRKIYVIIAARNEENCIAETLTSIHQQTYPVNKIFVVANNCTDDTAKIANQNGAIVFEMLKNPHMKAGALNYAIEKIIPQFKDTDCILIMDADTKLSVNLVEKCIEKFDENPKVGAVGSIFTGRPSQSLLGQLQLMEFWRYRRQIHRNGNIAFVLSGTASLFLVKTLKEVKKARNDGRLPYGGGNYYDICGLTEDNEITLAIKTLDYDCPTSNVFSETDVMDTLIKLKNQRIRWYQGAMVNLKAFGWSLPYHLRWTYWKQQIGLFTSLILFFLILTSLAINQFVLGGIILTWIWLIPLGILVIEQTITVWSLGWKARLIAISIIPEQIYNILLLLIYGIALKNFIISKKGQWQNT